MREASCSQELQCLGGSWGAAPCLPSLTPPLCPAPGFGHAAGLPQAPDLGGGRAAGGGRGGRAAHRPSGGERGAAGGEAGGPGLQGERAGAKSSSRCPCSLLRLGGGWCMSPGAADLPGRVSGSLAVNWERGRGMPKCSTLRSLLCALLPHGWPRAAAAPRGTWWGARRGLQRGLRGTSSFCPVPCRSTAPRASTPTSACGSPAASSSRP